MKRFDFAELTVQRILMAVLRRVNDIPNEWTWTFSAPKTRLMKDRLDAMTNAHKGERCFIIGNGPSLAGMDLSNLASEITFGLNRIYLLFERLTFKPTYYVCVNDLVLTQFANEISRLTMPKFLSWNQRRLFDVTDTTISFLRLSLSLTDRFNSNFRTPFYSGGTVTYVALQIALIMGFSEAILIGVDHSFVDKGVPNKVETRKSEIDRNHFRPDYFPRGVKWQLPDLKRSEQAYALARKAFEEKGGRIVDATINGKCPVFERADFYSLF